jgi:hypothetical protein
LRQMVLQLLPEKSQRWHRCWSTTLQGARFFQVICMQHGAISKDSPSGRACPPVTRIEGANSSKYSQHLPRSLETLAFGRQFNQSLDAVSLPSSLESLTFGINFNHTLKGVNLQDLVVGL